MYKSLSAIVFLGLFLAGYSWAQDPHEVQENLKSAIRLQQRVQSLGDQWEKQREHLLKKIRDLKNQKHWLDFQIKKHKAYIRQEENTIKELERREAELSKINMALAPYLDQVVDRLDEFVKKDLPFLPEERQKRLAFLRQSLDDYHLDLGEKLRRVLEALMVEADYGRSVDDYDGELELSGKKVQVRIFRLGRLGLYYEALDGKKIGWYNRKKGSWETLPSGYKRDIELAVEIAERKRATELVYLPVGRPK